MKKYLMAMGKVAAVLLLGLIFNMHPQTFAQAATPAGWDVKDNTPPGATIEEAYSEELGKNIIRLSGSGVANAYRLRDADGTKWDEPVKRTIQWQMKYSEGYQVYISCDTTAGHRYMYYTASSSDLLDNKNVRYIHHGLGSQTKNGQWQTITRNLTEDLHDAQPSVDITNVNFFMIRGSGEVADIEVLDTPVSSIIPRLIRFQASLEDAQGTSDGTFDLTFRLYDTETEGTPIWEELQQDVVVEDGLVDVKLGSQTPLDLPFDKQYWLGVEVGSDGEMKPLFDFTTVPYSFKTIQ